MDDSLIGYISRSLYDPVYGDSAIGYAVATLYDPGSYHNSDIGYSATNLKPPHNPIGTWTGTSIQWVPIRTWNGEELV